MPSFNRTVKEEAISAKITKSDFFSLLTPILYLSNIKKKDDEISITITMRYQFILDYLKELLNTLYQIDSIISSNKRDFNLIIKDPKILKEFSFLKSEFVSIDIKSYDLKYFVTGIFLFKGYIIDPSKRYHLEFVINTEELADLLIETLKDKKIGAKKIIKRNKYLVYIKQVDMIIDFLSLIEVNNSMYQLFDIKIRLDMNISSMRMENCYVYNDMKSLRKARDQIAHINAVGLHNLNGVLFDVAVLRLDNPEATLLELATIYSRNVKKEYSKAGINYYFKLIEEKYNNLG